ncbi:hypothetical protein, conserved [Eimeria maxima]|uniref:Kelch motif domain-containing protein n=1 Tax=Eimeria maxima TaxID=5804 RepID=U6MDB0_EIMMA|nr:hypothetical protein, conserved [Eimeria maxima]CDJ59645.1 hypothetical protein, conserved [Eimeria maxima]
MPASHLGDERKAPAAIAAAANAQRLQYALKGLCLWEDEEGKDEGQRRGNRRTLMKGSSPPGFVLSMTARWPGCQTLCSFTAADLGSRVALWIVESPVDPPAMVVYHPKKQKLEEEKGSGELPEAGLGVSLTPACIKGVEGAFLFGGRSHLGDIVNDCFFYNSANRKWTKLKCQGEKPAKRCFHAAAFSAKTQSLYVFGGQGEDGNTLAATCKLVNAKEWVELANQDAPPPRTHHSLSVVEGATTGESLLLFGGLVDGSDTNDLWVLPIASKKPAWHRLGEVSGTPPAKRHGHSATVAGPRCFIFGGVGKHWMGWEISYFDMNAYDVEVSSWFSVNLLSPLADLPSHGLAVATGDPSTMLHVFAAGEKSWNDGSIFRLAAVCSTLDISFFAQGLRNAKVVSADNRMRKDELRLAVDELTATVEEDNRLANSVSSKTDELVEQWESLLRSISETHSDVLKKLQMAQELEAKTAAIASDTAAREAAAAEKCDELQRQLEYFQLRLDESEQWAPDAAPRQQSSGGDVREGD